MASTPILFILHMAAAAALLIWSVRLVRTGFERAFGNRMRLWLRRSTANRLAAAGTGGLAAVLMQSSTAVIVLMAGFVSARNIGSLAGLAIVLGADLGSAVVALILNSRVAVITPVLMLAGVVIFLRGSRRELRQVGRILIGLALVFVSLDLIRSASQPLVDSVGAQAAMLYLETDPVTAFVLAAAFTWLVHSSVAAVLLFATLATQGLLPVEAVLAMVLGANLGGAVVAVVLTLKSDVSVRRIVLANLVLRGGGAAAAMVPLVQSDFPARLLGADPGGQALSLHFAFNLALLLVSLPLAGPIMRIAGWIVPAPAGGVDARARRSFLDRSVLDQPRRAFGCAIRELVQMGDRVETMLRRSIRLFEHYDETAAARIQNDFAVVARMSLDLRIYLAAVRERDGEAEIGTRALDISGIAVGLEAAADTIARKIVDLAHRREMDALQFSDDGWTELCDFHDIVLRNAQHGITVLLTDDVGLARDLVEQKERVRQQAQDLERRHLERLQEGLAESIETSSIHLDLLRSLKAVNTSFAMIAYPLLQETGELLDSRLANV